MVQQRIIDWGLLPPEIQEQWEKQVACLTIPPMTFKGNNGTSTEEQLAAINRDPALCAKVLAVANSAAQGRQTPAASVDSAVIQLGQNMLQIIMTAYHMESVIGHYPDFPRGLFDFVRSWSAIAAITAFHLAGKVGLENRGVVSTATLIARLGSLVLGLTWPAPDKTYIGITDETQRHFFEMEKWRVSTPLIGQQLALHWGLPEPLPTYIQRQETPLFSPLTDSYENRCILVMCVASVVSAAYLLDPNSDPLEALCEDNYARLFQNMNDLGIAGALRPTWESKVLEREIQSINSQA